MEYLKNIQKNRILDENKSLLEFGKGLRRLKNGKIKIRKEIQELFTKPINISLEDLDKFDKNKMRKKRAFVKIKEFSMID